MAFENKAGINVFNHYGPRETGGTVGVERSTDSIHQLSVYLTGESVNSGFIPPVVIPKGAKFLRYILTVDEAFALSGTNPTVIVGGLAPATDGVVLTKAELEAVSTKTPTSTGTGTWAVASATGTTDAERVRVITGGTNPVVTAGVGKATLTAEFIFKARVEQPAETTT